MASRPVTSFFFFTLFMLGCVAVAVILKILFIKIHTKVNISAAMTRGCVRVDGSAYRQASEGTLGVLLGY